MKHLTLLLAWVASILIVQGSCTLLSISTNDLSLDVKAEGTFSLWLSDAVNATTHISFEYDTPGVIRSLPDNTTIDANSLVVLNYTILALHAGHVTVVVKAVNSSVHTKQAFVRIGVRNVPALDVVAAIIGWMYFVAWSISFYPQAYSNWRRKSVVGLNFDFLGMNITGFLFYSFFNLGLFFSPVVQREYHSRHPTSVIPVEINDVVFAVHAVFATSIQIIQCFIYERGGQRVSKLVMSLLGIILLTGAVFLIVTASGANPTTPWLTFLYYFSYVKLGITLIKYIPQAYFNCQRKSTEGWSIGNILLDSTGGTLSILQMFITAYNYNDWESIFGNFTKFGLGAISILFDVLFIVQHYCLYRNVSADQGSSTALCKS